MESAKIMPDLNTAAICGLFCGTCPFYPEKCLGCLSDKLTDSCACCPNGFRDCAAEHEVIRCSECKEFPCERLSNFSTLHWQNGICHHSNVIKDLEFIRDNSAEEWINIQTAENTCPKCGNLICWYDKNSHKCEDAEK